MSERVCLQLLMRREKQSHSQYRMTQTEKNWTMESTEQLEDQQTNYIKIKRETRQLTCQVIEEIEQLWEEAQRERKEIDYLKTKTEQQQEEIDTLTAEKYERSLLIKRLRLQMENVIEKLKENKNEAAQEKNQLQKMCAEIYQERETLERRYDEIMNEQHKLEMIKYEKTKSHESKEPKEPIEQIKGGQEVMERLMTDSLLSLMNKNKKIILEASPAKEHMEKNLADIKQELKRNKMDITQHRNQIEHIKHKMNLTINRMKHIHRDVQMRKATVTEIESRGRQKEGKDTFEAMKIKLSRIQEGMEELWDVLEVETVGKKQQLKAETGQMESMKPDSQNQRQDIDVSIKITQRDKEMECDIQRQKQELENKLAQVQSERNEIERIKTKIATERENIERDRQLAKAEMDAIKSMRESTERQKQELDDKLQRTKKEMREMEVMSSEIEMKKSELLKMIRMSKRKKEEISMMKSETEAAKDMEERRDKTAGQRSEQDLQVNMEDRFDEQKIRQGDRTRKIIQHEEYPFEEENVETSTKNEVNSGMQRVILEVEEIRMMLRRVREDAEHSRRDITEEKNQIKWMNFQAKKKKWVLDQQLEKTMQEKDELEIIKIKIQQQREKVEKKLEDIIVTILQTMGGMKDNIEKDAVEINNTQVQMLKAQMKIKENKEEVKKHMCLHSQINTAHLQQYQQQQPPHQPPQQKLFNVPHQVKQRLILLCTGL
ncbi:uncharacterized protein [Pagrus major]|uniref:uncharacterized protein n=1 Tax=Pagrus major TaxID=143350 RepID=UPI003CC86195